MASEAGWHPDPQGRHDYRYHDGNGWTDDVSDAGVASKDPLVVSTGAPTPARSRRVSWLVGGLGAALAAVIVVIVFLVAGGDDDKTQDPDEFFTALDDAVADFADDMSEAEVEFLGREIETPDSAEEAALVGWSLDLEITDAFIDARERYVATLGELRPPEGFPDAGDDYATGFDEFFADGVLRAEQQALDAINNYRETWGNVSDPVAAQRLTLPDEERRELSDAFGAVVDAGDAVEDAWESLAESAAAVGYPIAIAEQRAEVGARPIPIRVGRLVQRLFDPNRDPDADVVCALNDRLVIRASQSLATEEPDPEAVDAALPRIADLLDEMADRAPDELASDIEVYRAAFLEAIEIVIAYGYDIDAVPADVMEDFAADHPDANVFGRNLLEERIRVWFDDNCDQDFAF